jgi:prepilin signal peptidase PulO-like enzyme (type II secretory pathway)
MMAALLGAIFFGFAAYVGDLLGNTVADRLPRLEGAPRPMAVPTIWLVAASAIIGAFVATHVVTPAQLVLVAIVICALVAGWCTDARTGIVPDWFTLGPLAIMLVVGLWQHEWWLFVSAFVPFAPFAIAAFLSKGRGMGWGDVKLAALGGAVLGAQISLFVFAVACLIAVGAAYLAKQKGGAIAFAPYLAGAIAVGIPIGFIW